MISFHLGRASAGRTVTLHPAWLLAPLGLALAALIGLLQGRFQSEMLAAMILGAGLALLWVALVAIRPEWALIFYTFAAVNLNGTELPLPLGGVRVSPDVVLTMLLMLGTALRLLAQRRPLNRLKITAPYLIFLAVPIITLVWSPVPVQSVKGVLRFFSYYALIWLIVDTIRTREQVLRMVAAVMLSLIIPVTAGALQLLTGSGQVIWAGANYNRIYGLAGGPFTLAYYLVLIIPLLVAFFLGGNSEPAADPRQPGAAGQARARFPIGRRVLAILLLAAVVALVLTFIRGAWIALLLTLVLLGVLRGSVRFRQLLFTIPGAALLTVIVYSPALDRLAQAADPNSTLFGRMEIWKFAWEWVILNPLNFLVGVGMKAFEYHYILLSGPLTSGVSGLFWRREQFLVGNRPHNELVGFMLDTGLIGTVALIVVLVMVIRTAVRVLQEGPDDMLRLFALAFLVSSAGMLIGAMGDNVFSQPTVAVYYWLMAGLILAIDKNLMGDAATAGATQAAEGAVLG